MKQMVDGRWKVTYLDGFGRAIQVDAGHDGTPGYNPVSLVLTEYAPCACSPLGAYSRAIRSSFLSESDQYS